MRRRIRQTTFKQFNWGGKRRGAGRNPKGERAGVSHAKRPELKREHPLLVTLSIDKSLPNLRVVPVLELFHEIVEAVNARGDFHVVEFSLQRDHAHLVVEVESKLALSRVMNSLVARFARGLNRMLRRRGKVFPNRYHAEASTHLPRCATSWSTCSATGASTACGMVRRPIRSPRARSSMAGPTGRVPNRDGCRAPAPGCSRSAGVAAGSSRCSKLPSAADPQPGGAAASRA
jgi:REP element-mobilizing transposase RayT